MTTPNPQNSQTRWDTYGIRPDLYKQLTEIAPRKDMIDNLVDQADETLTAAQDAVRIAQAADLKSEEGKQQAIAANTAAIEANNRVDAAQNEALNLLNAQQLDITEALESVQAVQVREKVGFSVSDSSITNDFVTASTGSTVCTAKGDWVGKVVITEYHPDPGSGSTPVLTVRCNEYPVPKTDGTRTYARDYAYATPHTVRVDYTVYPLTQKKVETTQGAITLPYATWTKLTSHTWTAPKTTSIMGKFSVTWSNATYLANYKIRICKNDQVLQEFARNHLGPLLGNGSRTMIVTYNSYAVNTGDVITFEAFSDSSADNLSTYERGISSSAVMISWIE